MLSVIKKIALLTICVFSTSAQAGKIDSLQTGKYVLSSGPQEVCQDFSIEKKDLDKKNIAFTQGYHFKTETSSLRIKSDLDPKCTFATQTKREEVGRETILKNIREESCAGNVVARTESTATISRGQIKIRHQIHNAQPYECIWKKK